MEDEHLVAVCLHPRPDPVDARRRDAEHRGADERLVLGLRHRLLDHAADGPGGVGEDAAGQAVEPGHVDDGVHHRDVLDADVWADVARGHGGHDELGHAHRERLHGRAPDGRATRAAHADDAVELALGGELDREGARAQTHDLDRVASIVLLAELGERASAGLGGASGGAIGREHRLAQDPGVQHERFEPAGANQVADVGVLSALGIQRADQQDGLRHCLSFKRFGCGPGDTARARCFDRRPSTPSALRIGKRGGDCGRPLQIGCRWGQDSRLRMTLPSLPGTLMPDPTCARQDPGTGPKAGAVVTRCRPRRPAGPGRRIGSSTHATRAPRSDGANVRKVLSSGARWAGSGRWPPRSMDGGMPLLPFQLPRGHLLSSGSADRRDLFRYAGRRQAVQLEQRRVGCRLAEDVLHARAA